jgi:hypothetical protein
MRGRCLPVRWSSSVSRAVVARVRGDDREAVVLDLGDGRTLAVLGPSELDQALDLSWSPDGRFISSRVTTFCGVSRLEVWEAA